MVMATPANHWLCMRLGGVVAIAVEAAVAAAALFRISLASTLTPAEVAVTATSSASANWVSKALRKLAASKEATSPASAKVTNKIGL